MEGPITQGLLKLQNDPTVEALYYQDDMPEWPQEEQEYTLVMQESHSGLRVKKVPAGGYTWVTARDSETLLPKAEDGQMHPARYSTPPAHPAAQTPHTAEKTSCHDHDGREDILAAPIATVPHDDHDGEYSPDSSSNDCSSAVRMQLCDDPVHC